MNLKLSSLRGSLVATIILVRGNLLKTSSEAFDGDMYGFKCED